MRNISFALTTQQLLDGTKTVTRRLGWKFLTPGSMLCACEKCMGLRKGEKIRKLAVLEVTGVRFESLRRMIYLGHYGQVEAIREGFPYLTGEEFVEMFCRHMRCTPKARITRIEFKIVHLFPQP